jgi:hypothetical protein
MKTINTQEILHKYYTKVVEDLKPVDYKYYTTLDEEKNYPEMQEGTVVVSTGSGPEDEDQVVVRTPDNIYYLVNENEEEPIKFEETPEVPKGTPIDDLYEINHYDDYGTHYLYTSYTSETGLLIHLITENVDPYLGGFYTLTKEFVEKVYKI